MQNLGLVSSTSLPSFVSPKKRAQDVCRELSDLADRLNQNGLLQGEGAPAPAEHAVKEGNGSIMAVAQQINGTDMASQTVSVVNTATSPLVTHWI